jgi:protein-tyrosine phosphatase
MRPSIYKVTQIGKGFLAVMAKPVAGEWIEEEFHGISHFGIQCLVSLLEEHEIKELGLSSAANLCTLNGIHFIHFPIKDRGVPPPSAKIFDVIEDVYQRILSGENTVIHCRAGIGRTGLLAASVLVKHGHSPTDAFHMVSTARRVDVPETPEQSEWVRSNQKKLQLKTG